MRKGVDIGGTFVKICWEDGRREKIPIREYAEDPQHLVPRLLEIILDGSPEAVGIAVAGFTSHEGHITRSPNLPALDNTPLQELVSREGLPCRVGNDVSVAAFGEWTFDHPQSRVLILVAVGTGLGGGLVLEGRPYLGVGGSAMEIGHHILQKGGPLCSCGRQGCWEALCSSYAIEREYQARTGRPLLAYQVAQAAREGDGGAREVLADFREALLVGLHNLVHIFNPDCLVVGGGTVEMARDFLGDLEAALKQRVEPLPATGLRVAYSRGEEFLAARAALEWIRLETEPIPPGGPPGGPAGRPAGPEAPR